jgi:hypothetical protein
MTDKVVILQSPESMRVFPHTFFKEKSMQKTYQNCPADFTRSHFFEKKWVKKLFTVGPSTAPRRFNYIWLQSSPVWGHVCRGL